MVGGTVEFWLSDEGWGAIEFDGGRLAFAHFTDIRGVEGYRKLFAGQHVEANVAPFRQDGYDWVASDVRVLD